MNTTIKAAAVLFLASACASVRAVPVTVPAQDVNIHFDEDGSYHGNLITLVGGMYFDTYVMPPWSVDGNALVLSPSLWLEVGGSGYAETGYLGFEVYGFAFTPLVGYQITGYQIQFEGSASSLGDGSFYIEGSEGNWTGSGDQYTFSTGVMGSMPASFYGRMQLDAPYVEGPGGTALVYGTARGSIDRIRIEALTAPVPEPETWALSGAGLIALTLLRRRQRR